MFLAIVQACCGFSCIPSPVVRLQGQDEVLVIVSFAVTVLCGSMHHACRDSADVVVLRHQQPYWTNNPIGSTTLLEPITLLDATAARVNA